MTTYELIDPHELAAFNDALRRHGWQPGDFELQEEYSIRPRPRWRRREVRWG